jgi:Uncharacterized protein conserved in bacteria (DUF2188)
MAQERIHIVTHENGWAVKREGKSNPESVHATQKEAIDAGRDLALKDDADLVLHRTDGTFRKVVSVSGEEENMSDRENGNKPAGERRTTRRIDTDDVVSVGTRISWGAVLAGASVALALMFALGWLSTAIGLSVLDAVRDRTLFIGAMVCLIVTVVASLFVGGFVVSRITAGEDKTEALTYGVVLWGFLFALTTALASTGANLGLNALNAFAARTDARAATLPNLDDLGLSERQAKEVQARLSDATPAVSAQATAWWGFAGIILSMAAAIGGSVAGAGPTLVLRQIRARRGLVTTTRTQLQPQS